MGKFKRTAVFRFVDHISNITKHVYTDKHQFQSNMETRVLKICMDFLKTLHSVYLAHTSHENIFTKLDKQN